MEDQSPELPPAEIEVKHAAKRRCSARARTTLQDLGFASASGADSEKADADMHDVDVVKVPRPGPFI